MCIFINKANQLKKETLTKDAGRKLTTTDRTTNSKHHHSNTPLHREGSNTTRATHTTKNHHVSLFSTTPSRAAPLLPFLSSLGQRAKWQQLLVGGGGNHLVEENRGTTDTHTQTHRHNKHVLYEVFNTAQRK